MTPFEWQSKIVCAIKDISTKLKRNIIARIPPAHGKSIIIEAVANAITEIDKLNYVVIINYNQHLVKNAWDVYANPNTTGLGYQKF